jgi:hypothetical protein
MAAMGPQTRDILIAVAVAVAAFVVATLLEPSIGTGAARVVMILGIVGGAAYWWLNRRRSPPLS